MTQKELLYVEDAINHEKTIIDYINNIINSLNDEDLIDYMHNERKNHDKIKNKLINLLEEEND